VVLVFNMVEVTVPSSDAVLPDSDFDLSPLRGLREGITRVAEAVHEQVTTLGEAAAVRTLQGLREIIDGLRAEVADAAAAAAAHTDDVKARRRVRRRYARFERWRRRLLAGLRRDLVGVILPRRVHVAIVVAMHPDRCTYLLRLREMFLFNGNRAGSDEHCFLQTHPNLLWPGRRAPAVA
jgi:hypothetical protein